MHFVRYEVPTGEVLVGALHDDRLIRLPVPSIESLLSLTVDEVRRMAEAEHEPEHRAYVLLAPVDGRIEVWASGVTYRRSMDARIEESRDEDVYQRVYDAPRPELFFKANAWRVVTDGQPAAIRSDSDSDVPEPELAIALNRHGEAIGYLACNDMTARAIEAQNPIYLPQAKTYAGACVLSTGIRPAWEVDPIDLAITLTVARGDEVAFAGSTSTALMHRSFDELVRWLFAAEQFPHGAVLSTGTGIVPPLDFTLQPGDVISVDIPGVGGIRNRVVRGLDSFLAALGQPTEGLS